MAERPVIAIFGAGQMGSAVGARLVAHGARVITPLASRSEPSIARAEAAGMEPCTLEATAGARAILSIVPPGQAMQVADMLLPLLKNASPPFIDANALAPASKQAMAERVARAGGRFLDGVIIGPPPRETGPGPRFYLSGEGMEDAAFLRDFGLDLRVLDGMVGTAAALKMCYGGLNKGITALTTAVLLAAGRSGVGEALMDEWSISQPFVRESAPRSVPAMYPKAYRWIAEFEEIAAFTGEDGASSEIFGAIARFFEERALAHRDGTELEGVSAILGRLMSGDEK